MLPARNLRLINSRCRNPTRPIGIYRKMADISYLALALPACGHQLTYAIRLPVTFELINVS